MDEYVVAGPLSKRHAGRGVEALPTDSHAVAAGFDAAVRGDLVNEHRRTGVASDIEARTVIGVGLGTEKRGTDNPCQQQEYSQSFQLSG